MIDLIGIILKYIFIGIFKLFKLVWQKARLAGVLAIFLIIELMVLVPLYENTVREQSRVYQEFRIVSVEQSERPEDREKIFITIENKSPIKFYRAPSLVIKIDNANYNLYTEDYYKELNDNGYNFYRGFSVPANSVARITYKFDGYLPDDEMTSKNAKIISDDYSFISENELKFELQATKGTPDEG